MLFTTVSLDLSLLHLHIYDHMALTFTIKGGLLVLLEMDYYCIYLRLLMVYSFALMYLTIVILLIYSAFCVKC